MRRDRPLLVAFEQVAALDPDLVVGVSRGMTASQDPRDRLLTDLGLQPPPAVVRGAGDTSFAVPSGEQLAQIDGDALLWGDVGDFDAVVRALPLRPRLEAVRAGGEVFLDDAEDGAASLGTALSLPALLDTLVPVRVADVDVDPATALPGAASPAAG